MTNHVSITLPSATTKSEQYGEKKDNNEKALQDIAVEIMKIGAASLYDRLLDDDDLMEHMNKARRISLAKHDKVFFLAKEHVLKALSIDLYKNKLGEAIEQLKKVMGK